eukprot:gene14604-biopygen9651
MHPEVPRGKVEEESDEEGWGEIGRRPDTTHSPFTPLNGIVIRPHGTGVTAVLREERTGGDGAEGPPQESPS